MSIFWMEEWKLCCNRT